MADKSKRKYHGWIYIEKSAGYADNFHVSWRDEQGVSTSRAMGYGAAAAQESVDFFEVKRGLGRVMLEQTPLGLRVYTEDSDEQNSGN